MRILIFPLAAFVVLWTYVLVSGSVSANDIVEYRFRNVEQQEAALREAMNTADSNEEKEQLLETIRQLYLDFAHENVDASASLF